MYALRVTRGPGICVAVATREGHRFVVCPDGSYLPHGVSEEQLRFLLILGWATPVSYTPPTTPLLLSRPPLPN